MSEHVQPELPFPLSPEEKIHAAASHARQILLDQNIVADSPKGKAVALADLSAILPNPNQLISAVEQITPEKGRVSRLRHEIIKIGAKKRHATRVGTVIGRLNLVVIPARDYHALEKRRHHD